MQVTVGRVGRPHGIRGAVVVGVRTDEPELRFAVGSRLDTDPPDVGPLTVAARRWQSGELIVKFEGIRDRDAAGELRGTWLSVDSGTLAPTGDPDVFHDHELIGLTVRTVDGTEVGVVEDVLHPAQDVLSVRGASREVLVPFVKAIVTDVDVGAGFLVIDPPPGLLDLEALLWMGRAGLAGRPPRSVGAYSGAEQRGGTPLRPPLHSSRSQPGPAHRRAT